MHKLKFCVFIFPSVLLCACAETPKEPEKPKTRCQLVAEALQHEYVSAASKLAALEIGRNEGCFGRPPPVRADITIRRE